MISTPRLNKHKTYDFSTGTPRPFCLTYRFSADAANAQTVMPRIASKRYAIPALATRLAANFGSNQGVRDPADLRLYSLRRPARGLPGTGALQGRPASRLFSAEHARRHAPRGR